MFNFTFFVCFCTYGVAIYKNGSFSLHALWLVKFYPPVYLSSSFWCILEFPKSDSVKNFYISNLVHFIYVFIYVYVYIYVYPSLLMLLEIFLDISPKLVVFTEVPSLLLEVGIRAASLPPSLYPISLICTSVEFDCFQVGKERVNKEINSID